MIIMNEDQINEILRDVEIDLRLVAEDKIIEILKRVKKKLIEGDKNE